MLSSARFAMSVHALSILALSEGKGPVCSTVIAQSVHTNPVVIRRLMSELEKADLVKTTAGRSGGFALARPSKNISLADVYVAVEDEAVFRMHKSSPDNTCPIAERLNKALSPSLRAAECALRKTLGLTLLSDVALQLA
jgi:Rrf2 family protein